MTATARRSVAAFLHRAALVTAVLAIIAGIIGMHVMTGTHSLHSPDAAIATTAGMVHAEPSGHMGHQTTGMAPETRAPIGQDTSGAPADQCSGSGSCHSMQAATMGCIPSAKTGSLAAPLPGTAVLAVNNNPGALLAATGGWSYVPGSPSPGELCISRT